MRQYILSGHGVIECPDELEWAQWYETADRRVDLTRVGSVEVSTVFLSLDPRYIGDGPPLVFETLVFGGVMDGEMERCSTWDEAVAQHAAMVSRVEAVAS